LFDSSYPARFKPSGCADTATHLGYARLVATASRSSLWRPQRVYRNWHKLGLMKRASYPSDLSEEQWQELEPLLLSRSSRSGGGAPRRYALREVVNGLVYLLCNGCSWRALPHDLPPYSLVWYYFRRWRDNGTLEHVHGVLRATVRAQVAREEAPSVAIMDSQSVKTTEKGGQKALTRTSASRAARGTSS